MGTATVRGAPASRRAPLASPDAESDDSQRQPVPATVETLLVLTAPSLTRQSDVRLERLIEGLTVVGGARAGAATVGRARRDRGFG
jgi:hypothetical protein